MNKKNVIGMALGILLLSISLLILCKGVQYLVIDGIHVDGNHMSVDFMEGKSEISIEVFMG